MSRRDLLAFVAATKDALMPARELWVGPRFVPGGAVVALRGELDVATSPLLRTVLAGLIDRSNLRCVVVDMGGVTFIDSAGVHALVEVARRLRGRGGELMLSGIKPGQFKVLDICGLTSVFGFVDDPLSAVQASTATRSMEGRRRGTGRSSPGMAADQAAACTGAHSPRAAHPNQLPHAR